MGRRNFKRVAGASVGRVAVSCYQCQKCFGVVPVRAKSYQCPHCLAEPAQWAHFASKGEAGRWALLTMQRDKGTISDLERQRRVPLHAINPAGLKEKIGLWIADFTYCRFGQEVWEDYKGGAFLDPLIEWKLRHVKVEYGIDVKIVTGS